MVMQDFHGLKTMTFHNVADINYFWLAVKVGSHDPIFSSNYSSAHF